MTEGCHHVYKVVQRFGIPILVCIRCDKPRP